MSDINNNETDEMDIEMIDITYEMEHPAHVRSLPNSR